VAFAPEPAEIAARWDESRLRVRELVTTIPDDQLGRQVPGTPKWTVIELMSHVVGSPIDLSNGKFDGAGGPEWTQAQVDARRGRSVAELVDELDDAADVILKAIRAGDVPSPVTFDVITHEQDLRGALGLPPLSDPAGLAFITDGFAHRLDRVVAKAELPPLQLVDPDLGWTAGTEGAVTVTGSQFEFFRAMTGRRSTGQVAAMAWTADPAPYLALLSPFGPLRDEDVHD
jgi:uncharacterized protein (TIGR03083 family)